MIAILKKFIFALFIFTSLFLYAEDALNILTPNKTQDRFFKGEIDSKNLDIDSDTLSFSENAKEVTFTGNVKVTNKDSVITCQKMIITYTESEKPEEKTGFQKNKNIKYINFYEDVILTSKTETAKSNFALYKPEEKQLELIGNVILIKGQNTIKGDKLIYDLEKKTAVMHSNKNNKIKAIIRPEDKNE